MTLSALDKTWQFNVNQRFIASGSGVTDHRNALRLGIINAMLGFASSPWTVVGSSDSASAGMDGVNRWLSNSNMVGAVSGVHSWIVLQQTGIASKFQLCIDLVSTNASYNGVQFALFMSPSAGFGVANGGTNGTTSLKPTATDMIAINDPTLFYLGPAAYNGSYDYLVNVMMSTDGQCTRVFIRRPGAAAFTAVFLLEKVKNPVANWTTPVVARWVSATTSVPVYTVWSDWAYLAAKAPSGAMGLYITSEAWVNNMAGQRVTTPNEISGEFELFGMGVASETVGARGRHGRLYDMYWVSTQLNDGDSFPADGSRQMIVVGDMAIPWNGSVPLLT